MATPVYYQTMNNLGVDPTVYYVATATAGGSITPEYPAPPFQPGMVAIGSDGSQFIFCQASTSIALGDFAAVNLGTPGGGTYMANSITTTNVFASNLVGLVATGLIVKQSVTLIPAGSFFWGCQKAQFVPAYTSGGFATGLAGAPAGSTGNGALPLFVALTGVVTQGAIVSTSTSLSPGIAGIVCINSLTISIASSIVPQIGTLTTTGFTTGPIVALNNPRFVTVFTTAGAGLSGLSQAI